MAHHYDLSGELYALFLDSERQYTCAYHPSGSEDLETAQRLKERHVAAKLRLEPGMRVRRLRLRLGQPRHLSRPPLRRRRDRRDPVARAGRMGQCARGRTRPRRPGAPAAPRLPRDGGPVRPRGVDRHARACRAGALRPAVPADQGAPDARRRGAGPLDRAHGRPQLHQRLDPQVHLPRRLHPGPVGGAAGRSSAAGSGPPTSRSCACTTRTRCASGASGSSPTGTGRQPSTTSASAGCGNTISRRRRCSSGSRTG